MGKLKNEYKSFLEDIEKNIKNKEDIEYIKKRFASFADVVLEQMDYVMDYKETEMKKLEETQKEISEKMAKMQQVIDNIEKDIYSDEGFDFEIVCPYCNYEFLIDIDEEKTEVECPECKNIIELDWSGDPEAEDSQSEQSQQYQEGCSGSCHGCSGCSSEQQDDDDDM